MSDVYANISQAIGHAQAGRRDAAIALLRRAVQKAPANADANHLLGILLFEAKQAEQGRYYVEKAIAAEPGRAQFRSNLGNELLKAGKIDDAAACFARALELDGGYGPAWLGRALTLIRRGRFDEAVEPARRAAQILDSHQAYQWLRGALLESARLGELFSELEALSKRRPGDAVIEQGALLPLNYLDSVEPAEVYRRHVACAAVIEREFPEIPGPLKNERDEEKVLRVGYVCAEFRPWSVGYFLRPIYARHDRSRVRVYSYSTVDWGEQSRVFKEQSDVWVDASAIDPAELARRMRADGIDVLVDLCGHTSDNRVGTLASRGAPVQVTYLGYPNTTGLKAVDARLVDAWTDPEPWADELASERLVRLAPCFLCYEPPADAPEVAVRGAAGEALVFGSFNTLAKISPSCVRAWAAVLKAAPGSRLLVKNKGLSDPACRERLIGQFAAEGIERGRIEAAGETSGYREHLAMYQRVDVALDTLPYAGTTTTCEALFMGVPVVTVAGKSHVSRVGVSLLNTVGLGELVGRDVEEFVAAAAGLARDRERLGRVRAGLRERVLASALCDARRFVRGLEEAYRGLWRAWCRGEGVRR